MCVRRDDPGLVEPAGLAQLGLVAKHAQGRAEQMDRHAPIELGVLPEMGQDDVAAADRGQLGRRLAAGPLEQAGHRPRYRGTRSASDR